MDTHIKMTREKKRSVRWRARKRQKERVAADIKEVLFSVLVEICVKMQREVTV